MAMVDCRNLIEFCRAFERHHHNHNNNNNTFNPNSSSTRRFSNNNSPKPFSHQFCHRSSPLAALDLILLLVALGSLGFLIVPCFRFLFFEGFPRLYGFIADLIRDAPIECFLGLILGLLVFTSSLILWDIIDSRLRRCQNPHCRGLRKAVAYDIQLESEECVKYSPMPSNDFDEENNGVSQLELGQDQKELEAELKKLAPVNGRTVLIFRSPCGCPAGRLEVWGHKKIRRIKK